MQTASDPSDDKLVKEVEENVREETTKAVEAGVKEAKEDVAEKEDAKN